MKRGRPRGRKRRYAFHTYLNAEERALVLAKVPPGRDVSSFIREVLLERCSEEAREAVA